MAAIGIAQKMKIGHFQLSLIQCKSTVIPNFFNIYFLYTYFYISAKLLEKNMLK